MELMMGLINDLLRFGGAFQRVLILNIITASLFYFMSYAGGFEQASNYAYQQLSGVCRTGIWIEPMHALSIVSVFCINAALSIIFVVFGRFSAEELKKERKYINVSMVCFIVAALTLYLGAYDLPCWTYRGDYQYKGQIGAALLTYSRTNFIIFLGLLTCASTGFFYTATLGIKLITQPRSAG
jgi:hypothetical protein